MGVCQNLIRKKNKVIIINNNKIKSNNKIEVKKNEKFTITHNNDFQLSNIPTTFTDTSPQSKILSSPKNKCGQTTSNLSSNSTFSPIYTPHSSLNFNIEATIGETEIPIYIEENENIIIKINENINSKNTWSFLPNENPIDYLGYPNYKYKDNNIGSLFLRISGSQTIYHLDKQINSFKVSSKGNLLFFANLDPNDYSLYEPKGALELTIIGGNPVFENELNSPFDINNIKIRKNSFNLNNVLKEKQILKYINKARNDILEFYNEYFNVNDAWELNKELKEYVKNNNFKRKELKIQDELNNIAQQHCEELCVNGTTGEIGIDGLNIKHKIKKNPKRYFSGINIIYGINNPLLIVKRMILDKYSKSKKNRINIFFHQYYNVGISLREHISYKYCCVITFSD